MRKLVLPVGLAHKLEGGFSRNGWALAEVDKLCEGDMLAQFREVLLGHAVITTVPEHLIDLDADPFMPEGWTVEEHRKGGKFKWDPAKVKLYLSKRQQGGERICGSELREELANMPVMNANVLDYLFAHPHLIPEEWKGKSVFFWGTIYRDRNGDLRVRCLYWNGGRWHWDAAWLGGDWSGGRPAAMPTS